MRPSSTIATVRTLRTHMATTSYAHSMGTHDHAHASSGKHNSPWVSDRRKRAIDVAVAILLTPPALVVLTPLALLSAARFRTNPIFVQRRRGLNGEPFIMPKIRSLPPDWRPDAGKHELEGFQLPRTSQLLRRAHFDELPQLWCVLTGSMSLVGPRPMIDSVLERLPDHHRERRATGKPGLTGLWQISSLGPEPLERCPELDIVYLEHASAELDAWIIARTVRSVFGSSPPRPGELRRRARSAR